VRVHRSALKHGVPPEDAIQAATWALWIEDLDEESPARQLRLGFDTPGRLLETVVLAFDNGKRTGDSRHEGASSDARPTTVEQPFTQLLQTEMSDTARDPKASQAGPAPVL
jgi:hypothetical protein